MKAKGELTQKVFYLPQPNCFLPQQETQTPCPSKENFCFCKATGSVAEFCSWWRCGGETVNASHSELHWTTTTTPNPEKPGWTTIFAAGRHNATRSKTTLPDLLPDGPVWSAFTRKPQSLSWPFCRNLKPPHSCLGARGCQIPAAFSGELRGILSLTALFSQRSVAPLEWETTLKGRGLWWQLFEMWHLHKVASWNKTQKRRIGNRNSRARNVCYLSQFNSTTVFFCKHLCLVPYLLAEATFALKGCTIVFSRVKGSTTKLPRTFNSQLVGWLEQHIKRASSQCQAQGASPPSPCVHGCDISGSGGPFWMWPKSWENPGLFSIFQIPEFW